MPANTRPDWMNEPDISASQIEDPQLIASIEAAMKGRGIEPPANGWRAEGVASAPSPAPSAPGTPTGVAASGFFARGEAPAEGDGSVGSPVGTDVPPTQIDGHPAAGVPADLGAPAAQPAADQVPATLKVTIPGNPEPWEMDQAQALYLLGINTWVTGQPDIVKQQWAGIEHGTHTAVPNPDWQSYQAWVQAGRPAPQAAPAPQPPVKPDLTMLDDATVQYIQSLEARQQPVQQGQPVPATLPQAQPDYAPQPQQYQQPQQTAQQIQQQVDRQTMITRNLDAAVAAITTRYGLQPDQVAYLDRVTSAMNIVPQIAANKQVKSPTGTIISDAPMQEVFEEAFEIAMATDAQLKPLRENMIVQQHLAINGDTLGAVARKKANAGSLAAAPSAAVPGRNLDPRTMTPQQRHEAMIQELGAEMARADSGM